MNDDGEDCYLWLTNVALLAEFEDSSFSKDDMSGKLSNFIENNYPGEESEIFDDLIMLHKHGFIELQFGADDPDTVEYTNITPEGISYLTMLEEDLQDQAQKNEEVRAIKTLLEESSGKDKNTIIRQVATSLGVPDNVTSVLENVGKICAGLLPLASKIIGAFH